MGLFKKLFGKTVDKTLTNAIDSIGNLAKDIRMAIKNDIPADKRAMLLHAYIKLAEKIVNVQADVIKTETTGNNLQRNWRPLLMYEIMTMLGINYIIIPILGWMGLKLTPLVIPDQLWVLLTIGVNGYIVSRGVEKVITKIKK